VRSSLPPVELKEEDKALYQILLARFTSAHDASLREPLSKWIGLYGKELGAMTEAPAQTTPAPPAPIAPGSDKFEIIQ
jgi:hypothetical protein